MDSRPHIQIEPITDKSNRVRVSHVNNVAIKPGLYRIVWGDGLVSEAAIGLRESGEWWVAQTNWDAPAVINLTSEDGKWMWGDIVAVTRLSEDDR